MTSSSRWTVAVLGVVGLAAAALTVGSTGSAAPSAQAATCRPTPALLSTRPSSSFTLPGGAAVRLWQTGRGSSQVRVAAVTVPRGTLAPLVATSPTLTRAVPAAGMPLNRDPKVVAVINAQHFNPGIPGIPDYGEMSRGFRRLASATGNDPWQFGLGVYGSEQAVKPATISLRASARGPYGAMAVTAVNWSTLRSSGLTMYTSAWGTGARHPAGPRTVVVQSGAVRALLGSTATGQPGSGQLWLTAPAGTSAAAWLARLRVGHTVSVSLGFTGKLQDGSRYPNYTPLGTPTGWVATGGSLLRGGVNVGLCTSRNETPRPRSAIGWTARGDIILASVSNPSDGGSFYGGATVHQWADYLRQLGAVTAINLDGGTSTTLLVRRTVGGAYLRLDRATSAFQRPIVDTLSFRAG